MVTRVIMCPARKPLDDEKIDFVRAGLTSKSVDNDTKDDIQQDNNDQEEERTVVEHTVLEVAVVPLWGFHNVTNTTTTSQTKIIFTVNTWPASTI